jgi:hypothetical protein
VHFPAFPVALVAAYAWRKIRLVCDNGRLHTTQAVTAWLEAPTEQIAVYWSPPYCPRLAGRTPLILGSPDGPGATPEPEESRSAIRTETWAAVVDDSMGSKAFRIVAGHGILIAPDGFTGLAGKVRAWVIGAGSMIDRIGWSGGDGSRAES